MIFYKQYFEVRGPYHLYTKIATRLGGAIYWDLSQFKAGYNGSIGKWSWIYYYSLLRVSPNLAISRWISLQEPSIHGSGGNLLQILLAVVSLIQFGGVGYKTISLAASYFSWNKHIDT